MTQEEKAKAYDEILVKARKEYSIHEANNAIGIMDALERVFPELKDEGERIRKALKEYFINSFQNNGVAAICGVHIKDILAWLEKQGKNNMGISEATKQKLEDNLNKALEKETPESWNKFLDDKVEPKFKAGDWIVNNEHNNVAKVLEVNEQYKLDYCDTIGTVSVDLIDNDYHLWTIQDAKDGDVLADNYGIYIFDRFDEYDERCYFCKGAYQYSQKEYENEHMLCSVEVHPATKEQRDLLFQKMHEADYEWDAEKKELKKIEQKPADTEKGAKGNEREIPISSWGEEDDKLLELSVDNLTELKNRFGKEYGRTGDCINWLKFLKEIYTWKPSDEQIKGIECAIKTLKYQLNAGDNRLNSLYDDLKKLREV